jgi:hypothetical protein
MNRQGIEAIERGDRQVKVDELVALGTVLQVPFGVLIFGLGVDDVVGLPGAAGHPHHWQKWLEGKDSAPGFHPSVGPNWKVSTDPVRNYQTLAELQKDFHRAEQRVEAARLGGDPGVVAERIDECLTVLREIGELARDMEAHGCRPPDFTAYSEYAKRLMGENSGER